MSKSTNETDMHIKNNSIDFFYCSDTESLNNESSCSDYNLSEIYNSEAESVDNKKDTKKIN